MGTKLGCLLIAAAIGIGGCTSDDEVKIPPVVVGAKSTTESRVLAEIVAQKLERSGIPCERRPDLGGTAELDAAIRAGKIDVYVEYTATALTTILRSPNAASILAQGKDALLARLRAEYLVAGLMWTEPIGLDDPYTIIVRGGAGAVTMSEAAAASRGWRAAFSLEFQSRADGFPAAKRAYSFQFPEVKTMDATKLYQALADHSVDAVEGHSTDAALTKLRLLALEDDRHAFGANFAVPVVRRAALERYPGIKDSLDGLVDWLDPPKMRGMNEKVENGGVPVGDVVRQFIADQSFF
ncbi:MAG TPA: glycine betaine ABC transporter substrate-binding protein [Candidatus Limnocylindrales bacterium]|nr:glycine betaine ABC transporter substrate-binding protein [Candidatus Limnocylindrales bacterium]